MPAASELIANGRTVDEIQEIIGADRLIYLDLNGLIRSVRHSNSEVRDFDTSCFSGEYVTDDVSVEYLQQLELQRSDFAKARSNGDALDSNDAKLKLCRDTLKDPARKIYFRQMAAISFLNTTLGKDALEDLLPYLGHSYWRLHQYSQKLAVALVRSGGEAKRD